MNRLDGWSMAGHTALGMMCLVWAGAGWTILFFAHAAGASPAAMPGLPAAYLVVSAFA